MLRILTTGFALSTLAIGTAFAETEGAAEESMFHSAEFWLGIAFVIFLAAISKPLTKNIAIALDKRADDIARNIDEAQKLHEEAKAALESYKAKLANAGREAAAIVANAESEARTMRENAEKELTATLKRREELALEKIAQAEARATKDVRDAAVEVALAATRKLIAEGLTQDRANALIDDALKNLPKQLH
jgi:F-type H+-transporting ATPase subunit b